LDVAENIFVDIHERFHTGAVRDIERHLIVGPMEGLNYPLEG
jgi:hypothetical protein